MRRRDGAHSSGEEAEVSEPAGGHDQFPMRDWLKRERHMGAGLLSKDWALEEVVIRGIGKAE